MFRKIWLQLKQTIQNKPFLPYLPLLSLLLLFVSAAPFIGIYLRDLHSSLIGGQTEVRPADMWDLMVYADQPNVYHQLRILPEGLSIKVVDLKTRGSKKQINFDHLHSPTDPNQSLNFLSASFCPPVDIEGDSCLEGIVSANDSTTSYLISYNTQEHSYRLLFHAAWQNPIPCGIWDADLQVAGAADFGAGIRLIIILHTRRLDRSPREVIILDPQTGLIEVSWKIGAVPNARFGLLPPGGSSYNGFYLTTTCPYNGISAGGLNDSTGYLLVFNRTSTGWTMDIPCKEDLPMGRGLDARPVVLSSGTHWLIANSDFSFIVDAKGNCTSNRLASNRLGVFIEEVSDQNRDGWTDAALLSNRQEVIALQIEGEKNLKVQYQWRMNNELRQLSAANRVFVIHNSISEELYALFGYNLRYIFLDHRLKPVGEISLPHFETLTAPSVTLQGRWCRTFVLPHSLTEGTILTGMYNRLIVSEYYPNLLRRGGRAIFLILLFLCSTLFTGYLIFKTFTRLQRVEQTENLREIVFTRAIKAFHLKPSDVTLYMQTFITHRWKAIQDRVGRGTAEALTYLGKTVTHDSLREEVGLPAVGEERLVNLLILRRVVLHFLTQGVQGVALMHKLNFSIDPKYDRLAREAQVILDALKADLQPERKLRLNEDKLSDLLTALEKERRINHHTEPRRLSGELTSAATEHCCGTLRLVQGGREITLLIDGDTVNIAYHSKLSPPFTQFLSLIGLSPDEPLEKQILFPEEEQLFTTPRT